MKGGIFISYRREDAAGYAGRLYDRLAAHFGAARVFMDVEGIEPGTDFVDAIERAVGSCEILIVIIGHDWLAKDKEGKRRLDDASDFVRLETAAALKRGIRVVPVLVEGAMMPRADELPADLAPLVRRQAVELNHRQWDATSGELIGTLERILGTGGAATADRPEGDVSHAEIARSAERRAVNWRYVALAASLAFAAASAVVVFLQTYSDQTKPAEAGVLYVTPATVQFADQPLRVAGVPSQIKLENVGPGTVRVKSIKIEGANASDFSLADDPCSGRELAAGQSCALKLAFSAQGDGARTATLAVTHDGRSVPPAVALQGRGTQPVVASAKPPVSEPPVTPPTKAPVTEPVVKPPVTEPAVKAPGTETRPPEKKPVQPEATAPPPKVPPAPIVAPAPKVPPAPVLAPAPKVPPAPIVQPAPSVQPEPIAPSIAEEKPKVAALSPPAAALPTRLPRVGDSWQYQVKSIWRNVPPRTYTHQVTAVTEREVRETMSTDAGGTSASETKSFNSDTRYVEWRGNGYYIVEFNPFLAAFDALQPNTAWKTIATPVYDPFYSNWYSHGRATGWESVSVPAGSFKALRIELNSSRQATASVAMRGAEPVRVVHVAWYAPEAKRTVKHVRTVFAATGGKLDEDTHELVRYTLR